MPMKLPPGHLVAAIDQTLINILQKIANDAPDKDDDIHAVIVLRRAPKSPGDPKLYVDVNVDNISELIESPADGYPPIGPVTVDRLDYASALVYQRSVGAPPVTAAGYWYVVGGRRYHTV